MWAPAYGRAVYVRFFGLFAPALLAVLLIACNGDDTNTPTDTSTSSGPPDLAVIPTAEPLPERPDPVIVTGRADTTTRTDVTYEVQPGDSPSAIADRFNITTAALLEANDLGDEATIFVGQLLLIPSEQGSDDGTAAADTDDSADTDDDADETPPRSGPTTYTVEPGDTPLGIAFAFDITLEELAAANGVSTDDLLSIRGGDELVIPAP